MNTAHMEALPVSWKAEGPLGLSDTEMAVALQPKDPAEGRGC